MFNIECNNCKQLFESSNKNRKFCSQTCSAVYNNTGRIKRKLKYCLACSKLLEHNKKIYCNNKCQQNFAKNARTEDDLLNLSNAALRRHLIEQYGPRCMKCGWCEVHPITGTVPIELNHIDGNAENKQTSNLELLCPNCHSLTPNYRALNKGNGRSQRMERYRQGKSW